MSINHLSIVFSFFKKNTSDINIKPIINMGDNSHIIKRVIICLPLYGTPLFNIVLSTNTVNSIPIKYTIPRIKYIIIY